MTDVRKYQTVYFIWLSCVVYGEVKEVKNNTAVITDIRYADSKYNDALATWHDLERPIDRLFATCKDAKAAQAKSKAK